MAPDDTGYVRLSCPGGICRVGMAVAVGMMIVIGFTCTIVEFASLSEYLKGVLNGAIHLRIIAVAIAY